MSEQSISAKNKILVALDVASLAEALTLVTALARYVGGFKVGLELCHSAGTQEVINAVSKAGGAVFLDLKFKDIPNQVKGAAYAVARQGVLMFNVHCDGGSEMLKAAVTAARAANTTAGKGPLIIGVTVLTSIDEPTMNQEMKVSGRVVDQVVHLASLAKQCGLNGVVCSAHEIVPIKQALGPEFITVVPGIRPEWAAAGDQKRVMTPAEAVSCGADYLVIGRPITNPPAHIGLPVEAAKLIVKEIEGSLTPVS